MMDWVLTFTLVVVLLYLFWVAKRKQTPNLFAAIGFLLCIWMGAMSWSSGVLQAFVGGPNPSEVVQEISSEADLADYLPENPPKEGPVEVPVKDLKDFLGEMEDLTGRPFSAYPVGSGRYLLISLYNIQDVIFFYWDLFYITNLQFPFTYSSIEGDEFTIPGPWPANLDYVERTTGKRLEEYNDSEGTRRHRLVTN